MKARKVWIAEHPTQAGNREVSFTEPRDDRVYLSSQFHGQDDAFVEWEEFVLIPVETGA